MNSNIAIVSGHGGFTNSVSVILVTGNSRGSSVNPEPFRKEAREIHKVLRDSLAWPTLDYLLLEMLVSYSNSTLSQRDKFSVIDAIVADLKSTNLYIEGDVSGQENH